MTQQEIMRLVDERIAAAFQGMSIRGDGLHIDVHRAQNVWNLRFHPEAKAQGGGGSGVGNPVCITAETLNAVISGFVDYSCFTTGGVSPSWTAALSELNGAIELTQTDATHWEAIKIINAHRFIDSTDCSGDDEALTRQVLIAVWCQDGNYQVSVTFLYQDTEYPPSWGGLAIFYASGGSSPFNYHDAITDADISITFDEI